MNCTRCFHANPDTAHYCNNCGMSLTGQWQPGGFPSYNPATQEPVKDRSVIYLLILMGVGTATSIVWTLLSRFLTPILMNSGPGSISTFYSVMSGATMLLSLILMIVFAVMSKNRTVRTWLIIFAIADLLLHLVNFLPGLFRHSGF